jgi:hypothetical protein
MHRWLTLPVLGVLAVLPLFLVTSTDAVAQQPNRPQAPARDTSAQPTSPAAQAPATGKISGRVLAADTGRPVPRARVMLSGAQFNGRGALTDDTGAFDLTGLPEGRFTLTVSKSGFVTLSYGQRRPQQAGTPLQLAAGQELKGIEFRLPPGSVVTGRVVDENGDPLPGTSVRILAYQYQQGNRQLVPAGNAQTDDRGVYRVWGLNPGDYYVSANPPQNLNVPPGPQANGAPGRGGGFGAGGGRGGRGGAFGPAAAADAADDPAQVGYAPTYYPGVASVAEARPITLGLSAEMTGIDFNVLLVRTSRISGRVSNPDGTPASNGMVTLSPEGQAGGRGGGPTGGNFGGRTLGDGHFSIANVPPGRYTLRVRADVARVPEFGITPIAVAGGDIADVNVVLSPAGSIAGAIVLQNTQSGSPPDLTQFRISTPADDFTGIGPNGNARVDRTGAFTMSGVAPGQHLLRAQAPRGWTLKSVMVDGRESVDTPFEVKPSQNVTGVTVIFTDKITEVDGTVSDPQGTPITDYTVLAFPDDQTLWRAQARQIMTTRPDQNGTFQIKGLPPGQYYLAVVDPSQQGEWFDPAFLDQQRAGAKRLSLVEGDVKTQDFKISR